MDFNRIGVAKLTKNREFGATKPKEQRSYSEPVFPLSCLCTSTLYIICNRVSLVLSWLCQQTLAIDRVALSLTNFLFISIFLFLCTLGWLITQTRSRQYALPRGSFRLKWTFHVSTIITRLFLFYFKWTRIPHSQTISSLLKKFLILVTLIILFFLYCN